MNETTYILGHGRDELRRLELQAKILAPLTARLLSEVGLDRGMRVLDIGTGAGDVAIAAAALVGSEGHVFGIDRSNAALEYARERARAAHIHNVVFEEVDFPSSLDGRTFDLVIGRYVLIHQRDPASFVRQAAASVGIGGALAFIEMALLESPSSSPAVLSYNKTGAEIVEAFRNAKADLEVGNRLVEIFAKAGLQEPTLISETPVGGMLSLLPEWLACTVDSVRSPEVRARAPWPELERKIKTEAEAVHGQMFGPRNAAGWVRL